MDVPNVVSEVAGLRVVEKVYDDAIGRPLKQVGGLGEDLLKALRLFTAPLQLLASYQDRLEVFLSKTVNKVPEERRQQADPSIAGPIIEKIKYLEEENCLSDLFSNLLAKAIDKERFGEAHPAFVKVVGELSPDEAILLKKLNATAVEVRRTINSRKLKKKHGSYYSVGLEVLTSAELVHPANAPAYLEHLYSLGLIGWRSNVQLRSRVMPTAFDYNQTSSVCLTSFGYQFVKACCE